MAKIKSFTARDNKGAAGSGVLGDDITLTLQLDSTLSYHSINASTLPPSINAGGSLIPSNAIRFVAYNEKAKTLSYQLTLPAGLTGSELTLVGITPPSGVTIAGVETWTAVNMKCKYSFDTVLPTFRELTANNSSSTQNENIATSRVVFTATAGDSQSAVSYQLTGTHAKAFAIDKNGLIRFKKSPDVETQTHYSLTVVASDKASNSVSQALSVTIQGQNEAVVLKPGLKGNGVLTVAKGDLASQMKSITNDFVNDSNAGEALRPLSFSISNSNLPAGANFAVINGLLTGSLSNAGSYRFTVKSNDGVDHLVKGKEQDASRTYQLVVLNQPAITRMEVSDISDHPTAGRGGQPVKISVYLSEQVTRTGSQAISANLSAGGQVFVGEFASLTVEGGVSVLHFTANLPSKDASTIQLTSLNLGENSLLGVSSAGSITGLQAKLKIQSAYWIDNKAPSISGGASVNVLENVSSESVVYKVSAKDPSGVSLSLDPSSNNLFSIDPAGNVKARPGRLDAETATVHQVTITATDGAGNSSSKTVKFTIKNVDERTVLMAGEADALSNYPLYRDFNASEYITPLNQVLTNPEGTANVIYRVSSGWLPDGMTLNAANGSLTGRPTGAVGNRYAFAITADDQVANGVDASRRYEGFFSSGFLLTADDYVISSADSVRNTVGFTVKGTFLTGARLQVFTGIPGKEQSVSSVINLTADSGTQFIPVDKTSLFSQDETRSFFVRYTPPANGDVVNTNGVSILRDLNGPTITGIQLTSASLNNGYVRNNHEVTATVRFNEAISLNSQANPVLALRIGSDSVNASYQSLDDSSTMRFTYTIGSADRNGEVMNVSANSLSGFTVTDALGNTGSLNHEADNFSGRVSVDTRRPSITSVNLSSTDASGGILTARDVVTASVTFSESVAISGAPTLRIKVGSTYQNATYLNTTNTSEANFIYTVAQADSDSDSISIDANSVIGGSFTDIAGNTASLTHPEKTTTDLIINNNVPAISNMRLLSSSSLDYSKVDDVVTAVATFSSAVTVTGTPTLSLQIGTSTANATYSSALSSSTLVYFTYTILSTDNDDNGISINSNAIRGGTFSSSSPLAVDTSNTRLSDQSRFGVDTVVPTVQAVNISASGVYNGWLNALDVVTAAVTFSEAVSITGSPSISLLVGDAAVATNTKSAVYQSNAASASSSVAYFVYTVAAGDTDNDGISLLVNSLAGGTIVDRAGNRATVTHTAQTNLTDRKVDTTGPVGTPTLTFNDIGTSTSDGITADDRITVSGLDANTGWEYRINGTGDWLAGGGTEFNALSGSNTYVVRQIDQAGNVSTSSNPLTVDYRNLAKGFVINGANKDIPNPSGADGSYIGDRAGGIVASAGDVNGDGLEDLLIGLNNLAYTTAAADSLGRAYVVFGKASASPVDLSAVASGTGGFLITGANNTLYFISAAGDVNGDGYDDVMVGNSYSDPNSISNAGSTYIVFGKNTTATVALSNIANSNGGYVIYGNCINEKSGAGVSGLGDINGDGLSDFIIGAPSNNASATDAGRSYVVFGKKNLDAVQLTDIANGTGGFVISGQGQSDYSGEQVSSAGDVNGDGINDILVAAKFADVGANINAGKAYVIFGKTDLGNILLANVVAGSDGFVINGDVAHGNAGISVSAAGDVNGDGKSDLVIGASNAGNNTSGITYVVFGKTDGSAVNLSGISASSEGFVINGKSQYDWAGYSVSSAGDVNGDGLADLIIGAPLAEPNNRVLNSGRSYVVWGKTSNTAVDLASVESGTGGFVINGLEQNDSSGASVSSAGDINGDGLGDLIVGAPKNILSTTINATGQAYVVFGKTDTNAVNLTEIAKGTATDRQNFTMLTNAANTFTGTAADEIVFGAGGNDTLTGGGGADVLMGGIGDDVMVLNASNITALTSDVVTINDPAGFSYYQNARVDGGNGIDTLRLSGGASLNLTHAQLKQVASGNPEIGSRIQSIEKIDLSTDTAANTLTLNLFDVLDMTGMNLFNTTSGSGWTGTGLGTAVAKHQLVVMGGATDQVDIADGSGTSGWAKQMSGASAATVVNGGTTYEIWNHNTAAAQLLIQQGVSVV